MISIKTISLYNAPRLTSLPVRVVSGDQQRLSGVFPEAPREKERTAVVPRMTRALDGRVAAGWGLTQAPQAVRADGLTCTQNIVCYIYLKIRCKLTLYIGNIIQGHTKSYAYATSIYTFCMYFIRYRIADKNCTDHLKLAWNKLYRSFRHWL